MTIVPPQVCRARGTHIRHKRTSTDPIPYRSAYLGPNWPRGCARDMLTRIRTLPHRHLQYLRSVRSSYQALVICAATRAAADVTHPARTCLWKRNTLLRTDTWLTCTDVRLLLLLCPRSLMPEPSSTSNGLRTGEDGPIEDTSSSWRRRGSVGSLAGSSPCSSNSSLLGWRCPPQPGAQGGMGLAGSTSQPRLPQGNVFSCPTVLTNASTPGWPVAAMPTLVKQMLWATFG